MNFIVRWYHLCIYAHLWLFKLLMGLSILTYGFCSVIIFAVMLILLIKIMTDWIKIYLFRHYWCKMEIMPKINIDCNGDVNNRIQIYRKILIRRTRLLLAFETFLFIQTKKSMGRDLLHMKNLNLNNCILYFIPTIFLLFFKRWIRNIVYLHLFFNVCFFWRNTVNRKHHVC